MFSDVLQQLRKSAKLTQEQFADILSVQKRTYGSWERNERQPDFDTLCKIADYFNVTTDYLLGREPVKVTGYQATELPPVKPGMVRIAIAPGENLSEEEIGRRITQAVLNQVPDLVEKELKKRGL